MLWELYHKLLGDVEALHDKYFDRDAIGSKNKALAAKGIGGRKPAKKHQRETSIIEMIVFWERKGVGHSE